MFASMLAAKVSLPMVIAAVALLRLAVAALGVTLWSVKILHHLAICLARERILIQNPYFCPRRPRSRRSGGPWRAASTCA